MKPTCSSRDVFSIWLICQFTPWQFCIPTKCSFQCSMFQCSTNSFNYSRPRILQAKPRKTNMFSTCFMSTYIFISRPKTGRYCYLGGIFLVHRWGKQSTVAAQTIRSAPGTGRRSDLLQNYTETVCVICLCFLQIFTMVHILVKIRLMKPIDVFYD